MAVGRISGPLLTANLLRDGRNLSFANTHSDEPLLFLSVNDSRISIGKSSPGHELDVTLVDQSDVLRSTHYISDTAQISNYTISGQTLQVPLGDIEFTATYGVYVSKLETQNLRIDDNIISTQSNNDNINITPAGSGITQIHSDMNVYGRIYTPGNVIIGGNITLGNDDNDSVDFNSDITSDIIPNTNNLSNLGTSLKKWKEFNFRYGTFSTINTDSLTISGNYISSTSSTSDLELRANSTGRIIIHSNNVEFNQDLTVNSTTDLDNIDITGTVDFTNVIHQGTFTTDKVNLLNDILIDGNTIQRNVVGPSDLELRTVGANFTTIESLRFKDNTLSTAALSINLQPTGNTIIDSTGALQLPNGTTAQRLNATGRIRFNTSDNVFEGYGTGNVTFNGVYSANRQTRAIADPTADTLHFYANAVETVTINSSGIRTLGLQVEDINFDQHTIRTNTSNSDLELLSNGAGIIRADNWTFDGSTIDTDDSNNLKLLKNTLYGHYKFAGNHGVVIPSGDNSNRPASPLIGDTRWNTQRNLMETWDGLTWIISSGASPVVSEEEFLEITDEWSLILG